MLSGKKFVGSQFGCFTYVNDEFVDIIKVGKDLLGLGSNVVIVDAFAVFLLLFFEKINNGLFFIDDCVNLKSQTLFLIQIFNGLHVTKVRNSPEAKDFSVDTQCY